LLLLLLLWADSFLLNPADATIRQRLQNVPTYCSESLPGYYRYSSVWWL